MFYSKQGYTNIFTLDKGNVIWGKSGKKKSVDAIQDKLLYILVNIWKIGRKLLYEIKNIS